MFLFQSAFFRPAIAGKAAIFWKSISLRSVPVRDISSCDQRAWKSFLRADNAFCNLLEPGRL